MASVWRTERPQERGDCRYPAAGDIHAQLERILASPDFPASARRKSLLRFLVAETLDGRAGQLKGFTIGVAVFGRDETFDPHADPVVRLEARRLRRDLDSYYATAGGSDAVRIAIPKGAYVPHFEMQGGGDASEPPPALSGDPEIPAAESGGGALPEVPRSDPVGGRATRYRIVATVAVIAILVAAAAGWLWSRPGHERAETVSAGQQHRGATVIVLPFQALSTDPNDGFLAVGLSEQLIANLMRFAGLRLYSADVSLEQSPTANVVELARHLDVAYVVKGSVLSGHGMVQIGVRLIDAKTGEVLWTNTYNPPLTPDNLLGVQNDVAARIATDLGEPYGVVSEMTVDRIASATPRTMVAYRCVLRAYSYRRTFAQELYAPIRACLSEAVRLDPGDAEAWALLGWVRLDAARFGYTPEADRATEMTQAYAAAQRAVDLAPRGLVGLQALSAITYYRGEYDRSEQLQRQALALNPNDPGIMAQLGWRLAMRGRWDEGLAQLTRAIDRSIDPPPWYFFSSAVHDYLVGDHAKALAAAEKAKRGEFGIGWLLVAINEAALGNHDEAARALGEMAARSPALARDPATWLRFHRFDETIVDRLVDGLRAAGWTPPNPSAAAGG